MVWEETIHTKIPDPPAHRGYRLLLTFTGPVLLDPSLE